MKRVISQTMLVLPALLAIGCAGSSGGGGGGAVVTPEVQAKKVATEADALNWVTTGDFYRQALSSDFPNGSKGQSYAGEYNMTGSINGIDVTVLMRAAYTADNLYMLIEWTDPAGTLNANRRRFLYNGPDEAGGTVNGWSSQLNDDKFALAFDIAGAADGTGTFAEKGCTVGCHGSMNPTVGTMDIWHWKASRSNPMGYVNDQWGDPAGRKNDAGDAIEVRNWRVSNTIAAGPGLFWDPSKGAQTITPANPEEGSVNLDPGVFLVKGFTAPIAGDAVAGETLFKANCTGCHGGTSWNAKFASRGLNQTDAQIKSYITGGSHPGSGAAGAFGAADWDNLSARFRAYAGVPGYYLQTPTGSNADLVVLNSRTVYNAGHFQVIVRRKLMTGNADDVQFDLATAKEYVFGVAVMENDGKNHAGWAKNTLKFMD